MTTRGWTIRGACREGLLNFLSGRATTWLMLALTAAAFTTMAWVDTRTTADIVREQQEYEASGGLTLIATNKDSGISQQACESLNRLSGIVGAAAVTPQQSPAGLASAPDANIPIITATAGVSRILNIEDLAGATLFDIRTARRLGLHDSAFVRFAPAQPAGQPAAGVATEQRLPSTLVHLRTADGLALLGEDIAGGAIIPSAAVGRATYCVVQPSPSTQSAIREALPALLGAPRTGSPTIVSDRLLSGRFVRNFAAEYQDRVSRYAGWAVGFGIGMLWVLLSWTRRDQDALYFTLGASLGVRALIQVMELLLLVGVSVLASICAATSLSLLERASPSLVWPSVLGNVGMCAGAAVLTALLAAFLPARSPLSALKDR